MSLLFAAMMGWCGTKWPGWRPWPKPHPDPDPEPWWREALSGLIGAGGGVIVAIVFEPMLGNATLAETALATFMGGVFLGSLGNSLMGAARR
jgi:hypothetical protein